MRLKVTLGRRACGNRHGLNGRDSDRKVGMSVADRAIAAAKEQQRFSFTNLGLLDLAQIERMVAAFVGRIESAFDKRQHPVQNWCAVRSDPICDALELVAAANRKLARERLLVFPQDIDGEDLALLERRPTLGLLVDRDQKQWRHQRDR